MSDIENTLSSEHKKSKKASSLAESQSRRVAESAESAEGEEGEEGEAKREDEPRSVGLDLLVGLCFWFCISKEIINMVKTKLSFFYFCRVAVYVAIIQSAIYISIPCHVEGGQIGFTQERLKQNFSLFLFDDDRISDYLADQTTRTFFMSSQKENSINKRSPESSSTFIEFGNLKSFNIPIAGKAIFNQLACDKPYDTSEGKSDDRIYSDHVRWLLIDINIGAWAMIVFFKLILKR